MNDNDVDDVVVGGRVWIRIYTKDDLSLDEFVCAVREIGGILKDDE